VYCKLLMSTLAGATLKWFVNLPDGHITTFDQFATLFREQYLINRALPRISYDVFDINQYQGEFLNRFRVQVVRLKLIDEAMMVHAFTKGMLLGPFSESLLRFYPKTFCEIKRRAIAHRRGRSSHRETWFRWSYLTSSSRSTSTNEGARGDDKKERFGKATILRETPD